MYLHPLDLWFYSLQFNSSYVYHYKAYFKYRLLLLSCATLKLSCCELCLCGKCVCWNYFIWLHYTVKSHDSLVELMVSLSISLIMGHLNLENPPAIVKNRQKRVGQRMPNWPLLVFIVWLFTSRQEMDLMEFEELLLHNDEESETPRTDRREGKRGRKPGRKAGEKVDVRAKLERSRQSARECRARKKLR